MCKALSKLRIYACSSFCLFYPAFLYACVCIKLSVCLRVCACGVWACIMGHVLNFMALADKDSPRLSLSISGRPLTAAGGCSYFYCFIHRNNKLHNRFTLLEHLVPERPVNDFNFSPKIGCLYLLSHSLSIYFIYITAQITFLITSCWLFVQRVRTDDVFCQLLH